MLKDVKILVYKSKLTQLGAGLAMLSADLVLAQNALVMLGFYQTDVYNQLQEAWTLVRVLRGELSACAAELVPYIGQTSRPPTDDA